MNRCAVFVLLVLATAASAFAQDVQTDPLQCWWKTSAGAVRVGEPLSVVLTCAVLETDAATVVVDQSRLEPSVVQFAPFELLGGSHGADLRTDQRRFFQYEYRLRLITETMFGKDAALPETKISYRVQSKVGKNTAIQGRDQTYLLPPQSVKVLSLVPADAADIRDTPVETFGDIDQRSFRANLFTVIGTTLFVVAGLLALLGAVRLYRRSPPLVPPHPLPRHRHAAFRRRGPAPAARPRAPLPPLPRPDDGQRSANHRRRDSPRRRPRARRGAPRSQQRRRLDARSRRPRACRAPRGRDLRARPPRRLSETQSASRPQH